MGLPCSVLSSSYWPGLSSSGVNRGRMTASGSLRRSQNSQVLFGDLSACIGAPTTVTRCRKTSPRMPRRPVRIADPRRGQPQRQGQAGPRRQPLRQGSPLSHLLGFGRAGCGLAEGFQGNRARLPLGQAGRPELPRSDLRHPDRGGRRGRPAADLVSPQPGLIASTRAPPQGGAFGRSQTNPGRRNESA